MSWSQVNFFQPQTQKSYIYLSVLGRHVIRFTFKPESDFYTILYSDLLLSLDGDKDSDRSSFQTPNNNEWFQGLCMNRNVQNYIYVNFDNEFDIVVNR